MELSAKELQVIADTSFLRTKQEVTVKIRELLGETRKELLKEISRSGFNFPAGTDISTGKISRGENYLQLPYQVLDFPKLFKKEDIFALRTMFWWGHFFSCTLHLQGHSLETYRPSIIRNFEMLQNRGLYICKNDTPWQYHYNPDNYVPVSREHLDVIQQCAFLKISKKITLDQWKTVPGFSIDFFRNMLEVLST
ncbi:MAG: hypothetical protein DWQ02_17210 [Bacteroidetes bacterium]|nr:MAG: hypothetical protein DWQ02_17210 [Bacteroidota bacterium]